jgi:hypothetical protein
MEYLEPSEMPKGMVLNNIFHNRMIRKNKNILAAIIGKTGSGKSWFCMSVCESWYEKRFKEPFPIDNICFTIEELMQRILRGNLPRGSILVLEEGGVNVGSLDFQTKIAKTFNYVLQSFRSLNVGLLVNLPYFSMLNKQTRMLMHLLLETVNVDSSTKIVTIKPLLIDVNQTTGKEYFHYPKVNVSGGLERIERLQYEKPSDALIELYEAKKRAFVLDTVQGAIDANSNKDKPTELQVRAYYLRKVKGLNNSIAAEVLGVQPSNISRAYERSLERGVSAELLPKFKDFYRDLEEIDYNALKPQPTTQLVGVPK